ncbi:MAG: trehalose 6-phosphate synthase/phosphatase [Saprospiraceae bacterium]|jgi:trehalose 6-phosphate synthase/phosphatase
MPRLIIISNRLPVTIDKKEGELVYFPSSGGLATGLNSLETDMERIWIGWPGLEITDEKQQQKVTADLSNDGLVPVFLTLEEIELYYEGFSNETIWPHFHYFTQYTTYKDEYWAAYQEVNQKFANVVNENIREDDFVWVHDYQLMLLPAMIRKAFPTISIGYFLHIPFPSYEIFRILPWREELLKGLLGADQIGFHTFDYMRHFLSAAYRISGYEHNFGKLTIGNRVVNVDVFPMGIDYDKYAHPEKEVDAENMSKQIERLLSKNRKLILSIDRLDYSKGIPERIKTFEKFIRNNPQYHGKVTLILIVVPSRTHVGQYQDLKSEIDTLVGRIDGQYRTFGWSPIQYFYRSLPFGELCALYQAADIAMITPLRDGMNLVAKEFVASKEESKKGVLILSEMAGAANELSEALLVNPQDVNDMVKAIIQAIEMPEEEQAVRLQKMQDRLKIYTVKHWATTFMNEQMDLKAFKDLRKTNLLNKERQDGLLGDYKKAKKRLILLDYDGTLMGFQNDPKKVVPDQSLLDTLEQLANEEGNKVVIISGRDRNTLDDWLGHLGLDMAAEHGVWIKRRGEWKIPEVSSSWKKDVRHILESLVNRTPGSFIEEKDYSIAWHYRMIDKGLGEKRVREFRDVLVYLTANLDLQVLEGNKVVEIKNAGINKGKATTYWLLKDDYDFMMAIGDDSTDEDIFKALPENAYTIKVGLDQTAARFNVLGVDNVRELLSDIIAED